MRSRVLPTSARPLAGEGSGAKFGQDNPVTRQNQGAAIHQRAVEVEDNQLHSISRQAAPCSWQASPLLMKIFEPENDKFIFSHVTLLGQPFQKQDTERRQPMFRHHLDQRPSAQDSIDGSVKTVLGHSDRLLAKKNGRCCDAKAQR